MPNDANLQGELPPICPNETAAIQRLAQMKEELAVSRRKNYTELAAIVDGGIVVKTLLEREPPILEPERFIAFDVAHEQLEERVVFASVYDAALQRLSQVEKERDALQAKLDAILKLVEGELLVPSEVLKAAIREAVGSASEDAPHRAP